jgi:predicted anti-sigma-YlaC factor YlaD
MPCNNLRGQLSLYGSGDLDSKDRAKVGEHLQNCPSCREHAESIDKTRSLLNTYALHQSSAPQAGNLWSGIQGRVRQQSQRSRPKH